MSFMVTSYLLINGDGGYRLQNAHGSVVNVISQFAVCSENHIPGKSFPEESIERFIPADGV